MTFRVSGAAGAAIGARSNQEDAFAVWPTAAGDRESAQCLAVVADGMGGHAAGEIAAREACEAFVAAFLGEEAPAGRRLDKAMDAANAAIARRVAEDRDLRGMGCTLVAAWVDRTGLRWVSAGDSALLLFRSPDVLRLNEDHSLGAFLDAEATAKRISFAEAERNPHRNALRSALTGKKIDIRDLRAEPYPLKPGDWLIVASDGIASLSGDEIGDVVYANSKAEPAQLAERLIAAVLAKERATQDNVTVVALKIEGDTASVSEDERPTRVLRPPGHGTEPEAEMARPPSPPSDQASASVVHPAAMLAIGIAAMFLIGWLLRALVD